MELTRPAFLLLLLLLPVAVWLARASARSRAQPHPLWFLLPEKPEGASGGRTRFEPALLARLAALAAVALAAAGPVTKHRRRAVVVDLSIHATPGERPDANLVIAAVPGGAPRIVRAGEPLVPGAGVASELDLAAAAALALREGATDVGFVTPTPRSGENAGLASARFAADALAPFAGWFVVDIAGTAGPSAPRTLVVRSAAGEIAREAVGDRSVVELRYRGNGDDRVTLALEPPDVFSADDQAIVEIPPLAPIPVDASPLADDDPVRVALGLLPTVALGPFRADGVKLVTADAPAAGPRSRAVFHLAARSTAPAAPLLAVPGSPLVGMTPALLDGATARALGPIDDAAEVWLFAGADPAVARVGNDVFAAMPDEDALLPVMLADLFAAPPLHPAPRCRVVVGGAAPPGLSDGPDGCTIVHAAPEAALLPASPAASWPRIIAPGDSSRGVERGLLYAALALLLVEAALARPRPRALAARAVAAAVIAAALFTPPRAKERVVYAVDVSASVGDAGVAALAALARSDEPVIRFAGGAEPLSASPPRVDPRRTDVSAAVRAASARLDRPGRIVLITDGHDTEGYPSRALVPPLLSGHTVDVIPVSRPDAAWITGTAPAARAGQPVALRFVAHAAAPTAARLTVSLAGEPVSARDVALPAGDTLLHVAVTPPSSGLRLYDATLDVAGDPAPENNRVSIPVVAGGGPRVLRIGATNVAALADLAPHDLIVLDDVSYDVLGDGRAAALAAFVDGGGTLLVAGGPHAFGPGGYMGTPLDAVLPLRSDPRPIDGERAAVVLVVDRSGSMSERGGTPLDAAALGALASRLAPDDELGVIAFDAAAHPLRPLSPAGRAVALPSLPRAAGATDPTPALALAAHWLERAPVAARRLVVLVSDGEFAPHADATLASVRALARQGARVCTVAVPHDAPSAPQALALLADIARAGNGVVLDGTRSLPALIASPPDGPPVVAIAPAAAQLHAAAPPALAGTYSAHVRTRLARDAELLASLDGDPLLAARAHGRGRAIAFAATLDDRWSPPTVGDALVAAFARTEPSPFRASLSADASLRTLSISVDTDDASPPPPARVTDPTGRTVDISLRPRGLGRFEASVPASPPGLYRAAIGSTLVAHIVPDPELSSSGVNAALVDHASSHRISMPVTPSPRTAFLLALAAVIFAIFARLD